jgi:2'-5' RNA ligase
MPYELRGKCVYKSDTGERIKCHDTRALARAHLAALRLNVKEAAKKYDAINFKPPKSVQAAARRGLNLRRKHGRGGLSTAQAAKQGIGSGVQRATNLSNGDEVSPETIGRMVAFFARHEKNKNSRTDSGEPGAGMIAWLLWGGDPGRAWAERIKRQMDRADRRASEAVMEEQYAMITLYPPADVAGQLALDGGEPAGDLHLTLIFLGEVSQIWNPDKIRAEVGEWALYTPPIEGRINALGRFVETHKADGEHAIYAGPDLPKLPHIRHHLLQMLDEKCSIYPKNEHGYTPHITLAYVAPDAPFPVQSIPVTPIRFEYISVVIGDERTDYELKGRDPLGGKVRPIRIPKRAQETIKQWLRKKEVA